MKQNLIPKLAVAYYRHSAEDKQEFSIPVQRDEIQKFAKKHNIRIIKEFEDAGKSGLLAKRPGFLSLYEFARKERFDYVLVFDMTRWGRYLDTDESAYYEVLFKREGKRVIYLERGFIDDEHPLMSPLIKSIDRYMAADYSRKLSEKVFLGSMKVASLGFSPGGKAPYGLKRLLLDADKKPIRILKDGERKSIDNERVTFAPGDKKEILIVNSIFKDFVESKLSKREIALKLNKNGIKSPKGKQWDTGKIHDILVNENYIGTKIYNKTSKKLKGPSKRNPRNIWIRVENAFKPILQKETFYSAQKRISELKKAYTDEYLIEELRKIYEKYKQITSSLINSTDSTASSGTYGKRFVSLYNAYIRVNFLPKRAYTFFKKREKQRYILTGIVKEKLQNAGQTVKWTDEFLYLNDKKILIIPSIPRKSKGRKYWTFYFETHDIDLALCIGFNSPENNEIGKYFLFPKEIIEENTITVNTAYGAKYENYAFKSIEELAI